jgi:hypothetical protein
MAQLVAAGYRVTAPDAVVMVNPTAPVIILTAAIGADAAALIVTLGSKNQW